MSGFANGHPTLIKLRKIELLYKGRSEPDVHILEKCLINEILNCVISLCIIKIRIPLAIPKYFFFQKSCPEHKYVIKMTFFIFFKSIKWEIQYNIFVSTFI